MSKEYNRHVIACDGKDCCKSGGGKVLIKEVRGMLGKDARDIKFSTVSCLGQCSHHPVMLVYPDGAWYTVKNAKSLKRIVEKHLVGGKIDKKHTIFTMKAKVG